MIVLNAQRTTAIVIRHDGKQVRLAPMKSGKLSVERLTRQQFDAEWRPADYPLDKALAAFIKHAQEQGATAEALKGLQSLAQRDACVVQPLF